MDRNKKQVRLIGSLVILAAAFAGSVVWLIHLEQQRKKILPNSEWGSPEEIAAAVIAALVFSAIIGVAILLQKMVDAHQSFGTTNLPPLKPKVMLEAEVVQRFFKLPRPRLLEKNMFKILWDGLFPPAVRIMLLCLVPLTVFMTIALLFLVLTFAKDDMTLSMKKTAVCRGTVTEIERNASRSGTFYRVEYTYRIDAYEINGENESYTSDSDIHIGQPVPVEYLVENPAINRIDGMRTTPLNPFLPILMTGVLIFLFIPGLLIYFFLQRRFLKHLIMNGTLVWGEIDRIRKGGRGMVFVRVRYELEGVRYTQKLVCPPAPGLYPPLAARHQQQMQLLLLVSPLQYKKCYLIEQHLLASD